MVCRHCPEDKLCSVRADLYWLHCECGELYRMNYIKNHERGPQHKDYKLNKTTIDQQRAAFWAAFDQRPKNIII